LKTSLYYIVLTLSAALTVVAFLQVLQNGVHWESAVLLPLASGLTVLSGTLVANRIRRQHYHNIINCLLADRNSSRD
jgi:uncharacterized membrane protein YfcA